MKATLILAALVLSGCADKILTNTRLADETAERLKVPAASIRISERRYDGALTTRYTASSGGRSWRCEITGGTVNLFGMTDPPACVRL